MLTETLRKEMELQMPIFAGKNGYHPVVFKDFKAFPINKELTARYERRKTELECSLSHGSIEKILFHGTLDRNVDNIKANGCKTNLGSLSLRGHAGQGFYLANLIGQAMYYQLGEVYTGKETELSVVVCKLLLGKCSDVIRCVPHCESCLDSPCDTHRIPYNDKLHYKIPGFEYCSMREDNILPIGMLRMTVCQEINLTKAEILSNFQNK